MSRIFSVLTVVFFFATLCRAGSKQDEGTQLVTRAIDISNIRASGAAAFRLKASFRLLDNRSVVSGNYSELWESRGQWRSETELGDFKRVEVAGPTKKWLLDSAAIIPSGIRIVGNALRPAAMPELKVKEIADRDVGGVKARCVESEDELTTNLYCVDLESGVLLLEEALYRPVNSHESYVYGNYQKLGEYLFPRLVRYQKEGETGMEITVSELTAQATSSLDASLFTALPGAVETANCLVGKLTPPRAQSAPDPTFPNGEQVRRALVVLVIVVGTDGKAHDVKVVQSGGSKFDAEASRTVAHWRFKPATCNSEPVATNINIEVEFRRP